MMLVPKQASIQDFGTKRGIHSEFCNCGNFCPEGPIPKKQSQIPKHGDSSSERGLDEPGSGGHVLYGSFCKLGGLFVGVLNL